MKIKNLECFIVDRAFYIIAFFSALKSTTVHITLMCFMGCFVYMQVTYIQPLHILIYIGCRVVAMLTQFIGLLQKYIYQSSYQHLHNMWSAFVTLTQQSVSQSIESLALTAHDQSFVLNVTQLIIRQMSSWCSRPKKYIFF